jgi:hypothetical protein
MENWKFLQSTEIITETRKHFPPRKRNQAIKRNSKLLQKDEQDMKMALIIFETKKSTLKKEARIFSNTEGQAMKKETVISSETDLFS